MSTASARPAIPALSPSGPSAVHPRPAPHPSPGKSVWAVGLMSGTSLDGIDAALIRSDGLTVETFGPARTYPYPASFSADMRGILGETAETAEVARLEQDLTDRHAEAVLSLLADAGLTPAEIAVVGFHGQTIAHRPDRRYTRQIGDGTRLAARLGCPVVFDFRSRDVQAGGEGAPLVPVYHRALRDSLVASQGETLAVLNIGGVANVTCLPAGSDTVLAFDTGPGNALMDDWALRHTGEAVDRDGALARRGQVDPLALSQLLSHPYFDRSPPKSLDRDDFAALARCVVGLSAPDGAATLAAFTVEACARACDWMPSRPDRWLICGGGRHNPVLMAALRTRLDVPVDPVEAVGWDGDALEAQAFAFLALRHLQDLPQTFPGTTGCPAPMTGGRLAIG